MKNKMLVVVTGLLALFALGCSTLPNYQEDGITVKLRAGQFDSNGNVIVTEDGKPLMLEADLEIARNKDGSYSSMTALLGKKYGYTADGDVSFDGTSNGENASFFMEILDNQAQTNVEAVKILAQRDVDREKLYTDLTTTLGSEAAKIAFQALFPGAAIPGAVINE